MRTLQLLTAALALSGCTVEMDDALSSGQQNVETHNRLATNRLATNRLATNRLATNRLATNSLNGLVALPDTSAILDTADGREVYSYLVTCAIGADDAISADIDIPDTEPPATIYTCSGGHCTFPGSLGLAPDWLDNPLDDDGRGWVSACIFARINKHATAEAISLRGSNPGLEVTTDEAETYTLQEGAFFGNLFTEVDEPIDWNACRGSGQAVSEDGGLALRDCAEPGYVDESNPSAPVDFTRTQCGFTYAGNCGDYANPLKRVNWGSKTAACRTFDSAQGYYGECHTRPGKPWRYAIAITSYVSP